MPGVVYNPYLTVLERITYLCESLSVALADTTPENYFYILRMLFSGKLFEGLEAADADAATGRFLESVRESAALLK